MKKNFLVTLVILFSAGVLNAQTTASAASFSPFETAMLGNIKQLDTASTGTALIALANNFERIGKAEKTRWQPFYYAAYCYTVMAFLTQDKSNIDVLADKAEAFLQLAEANEKENSEITCLYAMINSCRILVDPVSRFQTKGKEVHMLLGQAKLQNVNNPRIYLLEARILMRTPDAFGGGKEIAKKSAELALEKFRAFTPESVIAPAWGETQVKSLLEKLKH